LVKVSVEAVNGKDKEEYGVGTGRADRDSHQACRGPMI
jgi:hypothetical protein